MGDRMVIVHAGPLWEIQLLQGRFEEEGIPTFIPDQSTKVVDPFITGGFALSASLCVPEQFAEQAQALVAGHQAESRGTGGPEGEGEPAPPAAPTDAEILARIGARVRWASILLVTAPLAVWWGIQYLWRLRAGVERPREHTLTLVALVIGLFLTVALVVFIAMGARHWGG